MPQVDRSTGLLASVRFMPGSLTQTSKSESQLLKARESTISSSMPRYCSLFKCPASQHFLRITKVDCSRGCENEIRTTLECVMAYPFCTS